MSLRIKEESLELTGFDGGGIGIYHYNGKPFTGTMLIYDKKKSFLCIEVDYKDGYEEGWCRAYFENGNKQEEYQSHNNMTVKGTFKEWDENGNLLNSF